MLFHSHPLYSGGWIHLAFLENIVKPGQIKRKLSGIRLVSYSTSNASCQPVSNSLLWGRSLTGDLHTKQTQHMIYIKASASLKSNYTMWINCICIVYLLLLLLSICEWLRHIVLYSSCHVRISHCEITVNPYYTRASGQPWPRTSIQLLEINRVSIIHPKHGIL